MINIKVLKDCAEVSYEMPGTKKKQTKIIGISDIPGLFDTKVLFDSDILPLFGTENAYGVQRIIQKDNQIIVLIQAINPFINILHTNQTDLNAQTRERLGIPHIKTKFADYTKKHTDGICYKNIYLPNLLMSIQLKKDSREGWKLHNTGLLCYRDQFITDNTALYKFPFSNIYRDGVHGGICWGDMRPTANSLAQSVGVIHTFLGGTMNTHLFEPFKAKEYTFNCSSEVLAYLALRSEELSAFPYDDIKMKEVVKYNDLIAYLTQNWK